MSANGRVLVRSRDKYLTQKIRLELYPDYEVISEMGGGGDSVCAVITDLDTMDRLTERDVTLSSRGEGELSLPLRLGAIRARISETRARRLTVDESERCAVLDGARIRLTETEARLLFALYERGGEFVSRAELTERVFFGRGDTGMINVYVFYLREKLERGGERIIISSRKSGYAIRRDYLGGEEKC